MRECASQRAPLKSQPGAAIERIEMPIRRARRREADFLLNAMPRLVRVKPATVILVLWQRPDHHRPLHTGPLDSGVSDVHLSRQYSDKDAARRFQDALEITLTGSNGARSWICEQQRPA